MKLNLKVKWTPIQQKVFTDPHRFVVFAKGRRCGGTMGAAIFCVEKLVEGKKVLWIDTIQSNLSKYMERCFNPILRQIPRDLWDWNEQKKTLKLMNSYMDMRSSEKPENIEGFAYDYIVMNEAGIIFNDNDYLWFNTVYPMTLDYHASCIFVGTPKGKLSKSGKEHLFYTFYKKGLGGNKDWISYKASSYDNPLLDKDDIKALEDEVPVLIKQQEIHAEFIDISLDSVFQEDWFHHCPALPKEQEIIRKIISWDTAFKDGETCDYSCATVWLQTRSNYICIDLYMGRLTFPKLIAKTEELYRVHTPDVVVIEDKASGQSLIQMFKQTTMPVQAFKVDRDKISRAIAITPLMSSTKVLFCNKPWLVTLRNQCVLFPLGEFDDCVDSLSMALLYMSQGAAWTKERLPISKKVYRSTSNLNGYEGQDINVPDPSVDSSNPYMPPSYPSTGRRISTRETILQGF